MGKTLASNIVKSLNTICPIKSNRSSSVENGMNAFSGVGYGEIRTPNQYGLISVLAETDFHDNPQTARWIINSKDTIAKAYVNTLVKTFSIAKKAEKSQPSTPVETNKIYRVQVGAYSVKANAEAMLSRLKKLGTDSYIN